MSQYTIISKYGKRTRQLKFKKEPKKSVFPRETMAAGKNCFAPEFNELLENATAGSIETASKYGMKIFQGKNLKNLF